MFSHSFEAGWIVYYQTSAVWPICLWKTSHNMNIDYQAFQTGLFPSNKSKSLAMQPPCFIILAKVSQARNLHLTLRIWAWAWYALMIAHWIEHLYRSLNICTEAWSSLMIARGRWNDCGAICARCFLLSFSLFRCSYLPSLVCHCLYTFLDLENILPNQISQCNLNTLLPVVVQAVPCLPPGPSPTSASMLLLVYFPWH